jgi:hypothetical protein
MPGREGADWGVRTTFGRADAAISRLAARQRALITRAQLLELGLGRRAIDHAIARGRLHRIHQGIYSLVPVPVLPALAAAPRSSRAATARYSATTPQQPSGALAPSSMVMLT